MFYIYFIMAYKMIYYSKPCLKRPLKIDKTKVSKTGGSLVHVKSIAESVLTTCFGDFFLVVALGRFN